MHKPLVSIVMPAYNAAKYIAESVESILEQTYQNFELLILDDCSKDNTREILAKYSDPRICVSYNEVNLGYLKTCNKLFCLCKGDLITFQDADDVSVPHRIQMLAQLFIDDNEMDTCSSNCLLINSKGEKIASRKYSIDYIKFRYDINYHTLVCGATIMTRKNILEKAGYYHEYFGRGGGEDYEWFFRLVCKSRKCVHVEEELYIYRIHESAVKLNNTAPLYTHNIIDDVRKFFIRSGKYLLDTENIEELRKIEKSYQEEFKNDPSRTLRIRANGAIAVKDYSNFIRFSCQAVKMDPLRIDNYCMIITSIYNRIKGNVFQFIYPD